MPIEQTITEFGKHGIDGLVILALFALVVYVLSRIQLIIRSSDERFDKQSNLHAAERKEVTQVVKELSAAIQTLPAQFEARLK